MIDVYKLCKQCGLTFAAVAIAAAAALVACSAASEATFTASFNELIVGSTSTSGAGAGDETESTKDEAVDPVTPDLYSFNSPESSLALLDDRDDGWTHLPL